MAVQERLPEHPPVTIGLTGSFGSGCTTVAEILEKGGGFVRETLSDFLVEEAERQGIDLPKERGKRRRLLQQVGNDLRHQRRHNILIRRAKERAGNTARERSLVIDGIKNPGEIEELKKDPNAYVVAVDSSRDMRWNRVGERDYENDYKQFLIDDDIEKDEGIPHGQRVQACVDLADIILLNDVDWGDSIADKEEFEGKVLDYATLLDQPGFRPPTPWELLMSTAYLTSLQSRCLSRRVGAVMVLLDETFSPVYHVLATGYNHVPFGLRECEEEYKECYREKKRKTYRAHIKYCPSCGAKIAGGKCSKPRCEYSSEDRDLLDPFSYSRGLDVCRAVHAEESAILQTGFLGGTSLDGATLFSTTFPCPPCAKMIVESGILEVVYVEAYPMKEAVEILEGGEVQAIRFEGVKAQAFLKLFGPRG